MPDKFDFVNLFAKKFIQANKKHQRKLMFFVGAPGGDRTRDLGLKRPLLYH